MTIPVVQFKYEGENLFSPFSGRPVFTEADEYGGDDTLLFFHAGEAGEYAYISPRVKSLLKKAGAKKPAARMTPEQLVNALSILGAVAFEVDAGWNGVNTVAWVPNS